MALACTKKEITVVPGNQAPAELPVTQALRENYINRVYINLVGRKATSGEFQEALDMLGEKATAPSRKELLETLLDLPEYPVQLYAIARSDFLEDVDTVEINETYHNLQLALAGASGTYREYLLFELERLAAMKNILPGLRHDSLDVRGMHMRVVNNLYYDNINMGTENFVVATFQNFLFRYPTNEELAQGSNMVDGISALLFFSNGSSRADFTDIFFSSPGYYEGQVIDLYQRNLFRSPGSTEMAELTTAYMEDGDYEALQINILTSNEYFFN